MSQKETVFPGLNKENAFNPNTSPLGGNSEYNRSLNQGYVKGTVYPGMERCASKGINEQQRGASVSPLRSSGKPIVGFLYSISRTGVGEYWPLHVGQNVIGNSPDCDIVLGEGTVSQRHANLHVNKMKNPEKTEAVISDLGSTNGTLVNENSVSVARPVECVNGDIITVGDNYDLLLLLIDAKALGLHLSENFYDVRTESKDSDVFDTPSGLMGGADFPPRFEGPSASFRGDSPSIGGTVGLDSQDNFKSGGTVGLE